MLPPVPGKPALLHVLAVRELRAQPATRKGYGGKKREEGEGLHACLQPPLLAALNSNQESQSRTVTGLPRRTDRDHQTSPLAAPLLRGEPSDPRCHPVSSRCLIYGPGRPTRARAWPHSTPSSDPHCPRKLPRLIKQTPLTFSRVLNLPKLQPQ